MNRPTDTLLDFPSGTTRVRARTRAHPRAERPVRVDPKLPLLSRTELGLIAGALVLAALSLLLPSTPSYDPWAWIIWGREITELDLETVSGPSWKPLPVLFTTPFAFAGDFAPELWLVVARAGGLLALVFAFRLAWRLADRGLHGVAAGLLAVAGIALTTNWLENVAYGYSEGILTALLLFAVERHLDGRQNHAYVLGVAAALLRPEVWPFLAAYALWLWLKRPERRLLVVALGLVVPLLWFAPEMWGSGEPLRAQSRAKEVVGASPALMESPAREMLRRAEAYTPDPVEIGFALTIVLAAVTRRPRELVLAVAALTWIGLVAGMTARGYAGNERYLAFPLALAAVVAGVGWARLAAVGSQALSADARRVPRRLAAAAAVALTALAVAGVAHEGGTRELADQLPLDARALDYQAGLYADLERAVERGGGAERLASCRDLVAGPYQVPAIAWALELHIGDVLAADDEEAEPGTLFAARDTSRAPLAPRPPAKSSRFRRLVRTESWRVFAACPREPRTPSEPGPTNAAAPRAVALPVR